MILGLVLRGYRVDKSSRTRRLEGARIGVEVRRLRRRSGAEFYLSVPVAAAGGANAAEAEDQSARISRVCPWRHLQTDTKEASYRLRMIREINRKVDCYGSFLPLLPQARSSPRWFCFCCLPSLVVPQFGARAPGFETPTHQIGSTHVTRALTSELTQPTTNHNTQRDEIGRTKSKPRRQAGCSFHHIRSICTREEELRLLSSNAPNESRPSFFPRPEKVSSSINPRGLPLLFVLALLVPCTTTTIIQPTIKP